MDWPAGPGVRDWLRQHDFEFTEHEKPRRPKEAFEALLAEMRVPRSSALYEQIARKISLRRCGDPAFIRLRKVVADWFPEREKPAISRPE